MDIDRLFNKPANTELEAKYMLSGIKANDIAICFTGGYGPKVRNEILRLLRIIAPANKGIID